MKKVLFVAIAVVVVAGLVYAQKKPLSPPMKAEGAIGGKAITVDYSAPSMRGRKIFGDLVSFGRVWRTGANSATTLVTEADLVIGDIEVPKGKYTMFTLPMRDEWTLIISKETGQWGNRYNDEHDLGRSAMDKETLDKPVETFVIAIEEGEGKAGTLSFTWENTRVSVPVKLN